MSTFTTFSPYCPFRKSSLLALIVAIYAPASWSQVVLPAVNVHDTTPSVGYTSPVSVGGKEAIPVREIPQSVSVITPQRIKDQNLDSVTEALNQVTGISVIANDSTQSQVRSRGYSLSTTYDGVPAYNALSGTQQFDLGIYERVEVLRGPAGIFTGTDNPGGVVNMVRKRAMGTPALSATVSVGSWNNYRTQLDATGPLNEAKTVRGRGVLILRDRDYFYDQTHNRRWVGYGTLEWDLARATTLSLSATVQDDRTPASSYGLPAYTTGGLLDSPRSTNTIASWSRSTWQTQEYAAELEHSFENEWVAKVKISYRPQDQYFKDGYPTTGVNPATGTLDYNRRIRDYHYERHAMDLYATGPFTLLGRRHNLLLGYNREKYSSVYAGANGGAVTAVPFSLTGRVADFDVPYNLGGDTRTRQSGLYGQTRWSLADPLNLVLGARVSDFDVKSRSVAPAKPTDWSQGAQAKNEVTPYGALVYNLNRQWTLYGSYADIFIPQTQKRVDGSVLDPRTGRQMELGSKADFFDGKLNASLAYFKLRDRNRSFADPVHVNFYVSAGEVETKGWEFELAGSPAPGYDLQAGYTRLDTVYLKDATNQGLPFDTWEPRHMLKLWGIHRFTEGFTLGLGVNAYSGSTAGTGSSAQRRQGGYAVVNAVASYQLSKSVSLSLNLNNLFDRTYYTRLGGTNTYNTYGDPRNIALTVRAQY